MHLECKDSFFFQSFFFFCLLKTYTQDSAKNALCVFACAWARERERKKEKDGAHRSGGKGGCDTRDPAFVEADNGQDGFRALHLLSLLWNMGRE